MIRKKIKQFVIMVVFMIILPCQLVKAAEYGGDLDHVYKETEVKWALSSKTGQLKIYGNGPMLNYQRPSWVEDRAYQANINNVDITQFIKYIHIDEGVTTVGNYAFCTRINAQCAYVASTVEHIGDYGLNCSSFENIYIYSRQCSFGEDALCKDATLYGYSGSTAEAYARLNGITFVKMCENHEPELKNIIPNTCLSEGYSGDYYCSKCNALISYGSFQDATGHNERFLLQKMPTCTENGYTEGYVCTKCNETLSGHVIIDSTGHNLLKKELTEPNCTQKGMIEHWYCINCNCAFKDSLGKNAIEDLSIYYKPALGHSFHKTVEVATCTKEGKELYQCDCGEKIEVVISATGHSYKTVSAPATLTTSGYKAQKCSVCKAVKDKVTYSYPKTNSLSKTVYTYTGKAIKPAVTVKGADGKVITNTNYTLTYSNGKSTNVGKYTVKITFKGNYSGTKTLTYKINPKPTSIVSFVPAIKAFTVKWTKITTQTSGYQIQYSTSSTFASPKTVTVTSNTSISKKITSLTAKKKYFVRVRTYKTVSDVKYYSAWSGVKTVTTR